MQNICKSHYQKLHARHNIKNMQDICLFPCGRNYHFEKSFRKLILKTRPGLLLLLMLLVIRLCSTYL
jgi:hypothetical protein